MANIKNVLYCRFFYEIITLFRKIIHHNYLITSGILCFEKCPMLSSKNHMYASTQWSISDYFLREFYRNTHIFTLKYDFNIVLNVI